MRLVPENHNHTADHALSSQTSRHIIHWKGEAVSNSGYIVLSMVIESISY